MPVQAYKGISLNLAILPLLLSPPPLFISLYLETLRLLMALLISLYAISVIFYSAANNGIMSYISCDPFLPHPFQCITHCYQDIRLRNLVRGVRFSQHCCRKFESS
jgi:hypothetical protein